MEYYSSSFNNLPSDIKQKAKEYVIDYAFENYGLWDYSYNFAYDILNDIINIKYDIIQESNAKHPDVYFKTSLENVRTNISQAMADMHSDESALISAELELNYKPFEYYNLEHGEHDSIDVIGFINEETWWDFIDGHVYKGDPLDISSLNISSKYIDTEVLINYRDSVINMMGEDVYSDFINYLESIWNNICNVTYNIIRNEWDLSGCGSYITDDFDNYYREGDKYGLVDAAYKKENPDVTYTVDNRGKITITSVNF